MAKGDITSVTVRADGWSADVVVSGFSTGATYDYGTGMGTGTNSIANAKVTFTVTSMGYDATGAATTIVRTVYGVQTVRKVYPNQAVLDETGGGDLTFRMALSDCIYQKDAAATAGVDPTVTIAAALVTDAGGGVPAFTSLAAALSVTNNSTVAYPKVIGHFAVPNRLAVNASEDIEVFCTHKYGQDGKPVACVKMTATGATSANVLIGAAVTTMTLSSRGDLLPVYSTTFALTTGAGFTRGELVNIRFTAYPWVGDSAAILDSTTDAGASIFQLQDLKRTIMDKMYARVDGIGAGTPTASTSQATADANPFATIMAAMTGIAAANNSAYTLNRVDGGEIQCNAGTYVWNKTVSPASTNGCVTITCHSSTNRAGVIIDGGGATKTQFAYMRLYNVTMTRVTNANVIFASANHYLVIDSCIFADAFATNWYSGAATSGMDFIDCTYTSGYFIVGGNDGHTRLVRNCTYTGTTSAAASKGTVGNAACTLRFNGTAGANPMWHALASAGTTNFIIAYSKCFAITDGTIDNTQAPAVALTNFAMVCNVIERIGSASVPLMEISSLDMSNIIGHHNTFAGRRFNHENDIVAAYVNATFTNWSWKFNSFDSRGDHRADIFDSDATMIGTWSVGYSVGWEGNHNEANNYKGDTDFWGINSNTPTYPLTTFAAASAAGYTLDKSQSGTNAGNGDYTPAAGSNLLNKIPAGKTIMPYDITGRAYNNAGRGTAGAYQEVISSGTTTATMRGRNFRARLPR